MKKHFVIYCFLHIVLILANTLAASLILDWGLLVIAAICYVVAVIIALFCFHKEKPLKKKLQILYYCLTPLTLTAVTMLTGNSRAGFGMFELVVTLYVSSISGFWYYLDNKKPFNQWLLFVAYLPVPLITVIFDFFNGGFLQYILTLMLLAFYTAPLVVISLVIAFIISKQDKRRTQ